MAVARQRGGVAVYGCSGCGGGGILPADLTVENHGEDHAKNQQDGDGKGDSQNHLQVVLHPLDDFFRAGRSVDFVGAAVGLGGVTAAGIRNRLPL